MAPQLKGFQEAFLTQLAEQLKPKGFKQKEQDFVRKTSWGDQSLHISFVRHKEDVDLSVDVDVRHDAVEELVNTFENTVRPNWAKMSKKDMAETATVGAELGNLSIRRPIRWTIASEADIPTVCASVLEAFEKIGMPYLERFASLEETLAALSRDDKEAWLFHPFDDVRAKKAIAAAFVSGKHELFEELVERKSQVLREKEQRKPTPPGTKDMGLPGFLAFVEYLQWEFRGNSGDR